MHPLQALNRNGNKTQELLQRVVPVAHNLVQAAEHNSAVAGTAAVQCSVQAAWHNSAVAGTAAARSTAVVEPS